MAQDRGDGVGPQTYGLPAEAKRDLREFLRSEELPAQWQGYPLKTQQELMRGRKSITVHKIPIWAYEAEAWLRTQFAGKGFDFHTSWDVKAHTLSLRVFRSEHRNKEIAHGGNPKLIFEIEEPADVFITPTTLTKIILLAG